MFKKNDDEYIRPSDEEYYDSVIDNQEQEYRRHKAEQNHRGENNTSEDVTSKLLYHGDERILWCGKAIKKTDTLSVLGAIATVAITTIVLVLIAISLIVNLKTNVFSSIIWLLVLGGGGYELLKYCARNSEKYVITDRRVVISSKFGVSSYTLDKISKIKARANKNGNGNIRFLFGNKFGIILYNVENPDRVDEILEDATYKYKKDNEIS